MCHLTLACTSPSTIPLLHVYFKNFSPKKAPTPAPKKVGLKDCFDLYVDAVSNIPDNASIVKVFSSIYILYISLIYLND